MNNPQSPNNPISLDEQVAAKKRAAFEQDLLEIQAKHGYMVVPIQHTTMFGTMLDLAYMTKEAFDAQMKAGLMASGAKATNAD